MTLSLTRRADHWDDRVGVIDDSTDETVSYADLDRRAERTARRLAGLGVGSGDAVAVLSRNRIEHLAAFFACQRLGATLAPISQLEEGTISSLGDRIGPALSLHEDRFSDLAAAVGAPEAVTIEEFDAAPEASVDPSATGPEEPLLYLHTGGTTGVPKVVVVTRRQVEWNCITEVAAWGLGKGDVSPLLLPLYHTGGWHLLTLPTLYAGGRVVLLREFDPEAALGAIEEYGATHVFAVAAIFRAMADSDRFERADFGSVDWFMSGGGPTPEAVIEAYRERGQRFTQGYGLTEGGPNNLYLDPDREDAARKAVDSVGKPFPDCEIRIVGESGRVVEGEVGELELAGPVTADGYLETEDGTFAGGWVSTGDLAYRDDDGDVYITGRTDNMFVSGGENVYPEEIEDALEGHPDVAGAGVVGVPHERWGTVPKAVVVPADGEIDAADLEAYCRERLADYLLPRVWELVSELPRSGPGKLDRDALEREYGDGRGGEALDGGDGE